MKNFRVLNWALLLAMALPTAAFADVCQKDSPNKIRTIEMKDKSLVFVYITDQLGPPNTVGPNQSFTQAELDKKRADENFATGKIKVSEAGQAVRLLGLIFLLGGASPADKPTVEKIDMPQGPSPTDQVRAADAAENLKVLEMVSTSTACTAYVPSIKAHHDRLEKLLGGIYGQRFKQANVTGSKVERDASGAKVYKSSGPHTYTKVGTEAKTSVHAD